LDRTALPAAGIMPRSDLGMPLRGFATAPPANESPGPSDSGSSQRRSGKRGQGQGSRHGGRPRVTPAAFDQLYAEAARVPAAAGAAHSAVLAGGATGAPAQPLGRSAGGLAGTPPAEHGGAGAGPRSGLLGGFYSPDAVRGRMQLATYFALFVGVPYIGACTAAQGSGGGGGFRVLQRASPILGRCSCGPGFGVLSRPAQLVAPPASTAARAVCQSTDAPPSPHPRRQRSRCPAVSWRCVAALAAARV
jgi:hypothetical protein